MPRSAVDVIGSAFERTKRQLFKPFRWGQWFRLALVGFLAGEIGQGGGCSARLPLDIASSIPKSNESQFLQSGRSALFLVGIVLAVLLGAILVVVLTYINSRMRFVLFDSIIEGECRIGESWRRRGGPAFRYFVFQILFSLTALFSLAVLIGIPLLAAMAGGLFENPSQHILTLVLGGVAVGGVVVVLFVALALVQVLIKDFVVPQMALEDISVSQGWNRLWLLMKAEKGGYAGYIGMKVLLNIAASVILGIAGFIVLLIVLIPFGGIGVIGILVGRAAGLVWNPVTIAIAIVFGILAMLTFILLVALVSVPAAIFFPAYSLYFFGERYPQLQALLYSPAEGPGLSNLFPQP